MLTECTVCLKPTARPEVAVLGLCSSPFLLRAPDPEIRSNEIVFHKFIWIISGLHVNNKRINNLIHTILVMALTSCTDCTAVHVSIALEYQSFVIMLGCTPHLPISPTTIAWADWRFVQQSPKRPCTDKNFTIYPRTANDCALIAQKK